jgi:hypothetical protein
MKFGRCTAFVFVVLGWYLMRPPLPQLNTSVLRTDPKRPLARWVAIKSFPKQGECEAERRGNPWRICVATDDPRVK